jgi:hypothetical protein
LLQRLCVGPDGRDKRNEYDLRRPLGSRSLKSREKAGVSATPAAITFAFAGSQKAAPGGPDAHAAVTRNRNSQTVG